jgi:hypothetical protein
LCDLKAVDSNIRGREYTECYKGAERGEIGKRGEESVIKEWSEGRSKVWTLVQFIQKPGNSTKNTCWRALPKRKRFEEEKGTVRHGVRHRCSEGGGTSSVV